MAASFLNLPGMTLQPLYSSMRCLKCVYNAKVAYINVLRCMVYSDIYPMYYMALLLPMLLTFTSSIEVAWGLV